MLHDYLLSHCHVHNSSHSENNCFVFSLTSYVMRFSFECGEILDHFVIMLLLILIYGVICAGGDDFSYYQILNNILA